MNIRRMSNRVNLIGFLGMDPVVVSLESGKTVARFSMATHNRKKAGSGKVISDTTWHRVEAWGKNARMAARYLKKGTEVAVEGKLVNQRYESKKGENVKLTVIRINGLTLLKGSEAA